MTDTQTSGGRPRRVAFRCVAGLATLLTGLLTIGATEQLLGGALSGDERLAFLAHVPWLALCFCAGFAAMLWRPAAWPAAYQQVLAVAGTMYLGGALARENDPVFYGGFGVVLLSLGLLHPARSRLFRAGALGISPFLVPFALVSAAPLAMYAADVTRLGADAGPDDAFYTGIAATAMAVPAVMLVAGLHAPGWRLPAWVAGVSTVVLAGGSLLWPDGQASLGAPWAVTGVVAGVTFVAVAEAERRRAGRIVTRRDEPSLPSPAESSGVRTTP